jgi:hypothetical protein
MKRHTLIKAIILAALLILAVPIATAAQGYDRYDRRAAHDAIIRLDRESLRLVRDADFAANRGVLGFFGIRRETGMTVEARDFHQAVRMLANNFDWRDMDRSYADARLVVDRGARLDRLISNVSDSRLDADWSMMQSDLRIIADAYGLSFRRY